jgi:hypothetical protein
MEAAPNGTEESQVVKAMVTANHLVAATGGCLRCGGAGFFSAWIPLLEARSFLRLGFWSRLRLVGRLFCLVYKPVHFFCGSFGHLPQFFFHCPQVGGGGLQRPHLGRLGLFDALVLFAPPRAGLRMVQPIKPSRLMILASRSARQPRRLGRWRLMQLWRASRLGYVP